MAMQRMLMTLAVTAMLLELATATNYTVGGPNGSWDTSSDLQTWASSQSFSVGDNLIFVYSANHDVVEVSKTDFDSCQTTNPIQTYNGGNTAVPLTAPGKRYFICGTLGHCSQGMKLETNTLATSSPPTSSPTNPPPPVIPPASPPTSISTPPTNPPAASTPFASPPTISSSPSSSPPTSAPAPAPSHDASPPAPNTDTDESPAPTQENSAPTGASTPPASSSQPLTPTPSSAYRSGFGVVNVFVGMIILLAI